MREMAGDKHNQLDLPEFCQIWYVPLISAFALYVFKRQIQHISLPIFLLISKDQGDMEKCQARAERAGAALYKTIFYTVSGVVGYIILKDTPLLPA